MKKIIIPIVSVIVIVIIASIFRNQHTNLNIEREVEYIGPNVDSPSTYDDGSVVPTF